MGTLGTGRKLYLKVYMNEIRKNLKDLISYAFEEEKHINENVKLNKAKIEDLMFNDDLASNFIRIILEDNLEGFVMPYPYGNVIKYKERFNYYRGENQVYPSSLPSLNRMFKLGDEKYNEFQRCISRFKVLKFKDLINQIDIIKSWDTNTGSDVNYLALAQHYGIKTNLLDITSNLMIALFFACTVYDTRLKQYRSLNNDDIKKSKYGVIYYKEIIPNLEDNKICDKTRDKHITIDDIGIKETCSCIYPIGYQPFYRCSFQTGYYMPIHDGDLIDNDKNFTRIIFEHDVYLSKKIFDYMNKGLSIYPNEGIKYIDNKIDIINNNNIYYEKDVKYVYERYIDKDIFNAYEDLISYMKDNNIKISDHKINLTIGKSTLKLINDEYNNSKYIRKIESNIKRRTMVLIRN